MAEKGWIKLHRQIQDCWIWEDKPFSKGQAWVDLLLSANHTNKKTLFNGELVEIKKGQFITSIRKLSDKWGWNKDKVLNFLKMLESDSMIDRKSDSTKTLITIDKYEKYQTDERNILDSNKDTKTDSQQTVNRQSTDSNQPQTRSKECKNVNNNIYMCAFEEFWKFYPRKKDKGNACKKFDARLKAGFSEDELIQSAKNYADECRKSGTDQKYIKHATTFLSDALPFVDYLDKNYKSPRKESMRPKNSREFKERDYDYDDLEKQLRVSQQKRIQNLMKGEQSE